MASLLKASSKPKLQYHSSVVTPSENGGLSVEHSFKPQGDEYGIGKKELHVFGPQEHKEALDNLHSQICDTDDCGLSEGEEGATMTKKPNRDKEANALKSAKAGIASKLKDFAKKPAAKESPIKK